MGRKLCGLQRWSLPQWAYDTSAPVLQAVAVAGGAMALAGALLPADCNSGADQLAVAPGNRQQITRQSTRLTYPPRKVCGALITKQWLQAAVGRCRPFSIGCQVLR